MKVGLFEKTVLPAANAGIMTLIGSPAALLYSKKQTEFHCFFFFIPFLSVPPSSTLMLYHAVPSCYHVDTVPAMTLY